MKETCEEREALNMCKFSRIRGSMMGCSNPHPHGQIWASGFVPEEPAIALRNMEKYHAAKGTHMLGGLREIGDGGA